MLYRCQVVLKHVSGLPKDNVTNTFWVEDAQPGFGAAAAEQAAEAIRDFYVVDPNAGGVALCDFLNRTIIDNGHEIKVAPIDKATGVDERGIGFPPLHTEVFDLLGRTFDPGEAPSEVAVCLSFKNVSSGAVPPAQRRGRIMFGPVGPSTFDLVDDVTRPILAFRQKLLDAGEALRDLLDADVPGWVVYSRPYAGRGPEDERRHDGTFLPALPARAGATYGVTDLWVDNAFDTVRRRGEAPTSRVQSA